MKRTLIEVSEELKNSLTVCSWNVMADCLTFFYKDKPKEVLDWDSRLILFSNIITQMTPFPDIFVFEEVDKVEDFKQILEGYECIYKLKEGEHPDGSAIFWKSDKFSLVFSKSDIF